MGEYVSDTIDPDLVGMFIGIRVRSKPDDPILVLVSHLEDVTRLADAVLGRVLLRYFDRSLSIQRLPVHNRP